jgi:nucleotide-binding universal stress UspA family protein
MRIRNILVATDFSPIAGNAFDTAVRIARATGAKVTLAHVVPSQVVIHAGLPVGIRSEVVRMSQQMLARDRRRLERLVGAARKAGVRADGEMHEGDPPDELLRIVDETKPDAIMIGTHGRGGAAHLLLGSVAEKIVRLANCPVLVVKKKARRKGPVLVAVDDSPMAARVAGAAAAIAERLGARLQVVHAIPGTETMPEPFMAGLGMRTWREIAEISRRRAAEEVGRVLRKAKAKVGPKDVWIREGRPQDVVVDAVRKVRPMLVVAGTHGRRGLSRVFLGSVAEAIVRHADAPVLVVRPRK